MRLSLYDINLNRVALIGNHFVSMLWAEGYNTVEDFALELRATDELKKLIKPDMYVGRSDRNTVMMIKSVEYTNNTIIAYGKQATRLLGDVLAIGMINTSQSATYPYMTIEKALYYKGGLQKAGIPKFKFILNKMPEIYEAEIGDSSTLDCCQTMCQDQDLGFKVEMGEDDKGDRELHFELYKPTVNPNLVFSPFLKNLNFESIILSTEEEKNYALVKSGDTQVTVDLSNGGLKKQTILTPNISKGEFEMERDFKERLRSEGVKELVKQSRTWQVNATPFANQFGKDFDLGDMLTISLPEYDLTIRSRIKRFEQNISNNQSEIKIEIGELTARGV